MQTQRNYDSICYFDVGTNFYNKIKKIKKIKKSRDQSAPFLKQNGGF